MDHGNSDYRYNDFVNTSTASNSASDYSDDDISEVRQARQQKFDRRAAKRAKRGQVEPRRRERGFTRVSKEDRHSRW
jgi:hypothetical protein